MKKKLQEKADAKTHPLRYSMNFVQKIKLTLFEFTLSIKRVSICKLIVVSFILRLKMRTILILLLLLCV